MEKIGTSFIRRILLMMGGLLFLVVMILGAVWKYSTYMLKKNMEEEVSHLLNVYTDTIEYSLNSTDMNLLTIIQQKSYLEELSSPEEAIRYYASMHILELLKWLCFNNDGVDMLLTVGNYENSVSDVSRRIGMRERDEIIEAMNGWREERKLGEKIPAGTKGYVLKQAGETTYLVRVYDTQYYSVAAWIKTETLMDMVRKLEENSGRHLFLVSRDGNCVESAFEEDREKYDSYLERDVAFWRPVGKSGLQLVCCVERGDIYGQPALIPAMILVVILVTIGLLLWLFYYMEAEIFVPIGELMTTISYIRTGNFQHRIAHKCKNKEFMALNEAFNSMMDTIWQLRIQEYEKRIQLQETELKYFQMQIRPHFFLNAMATIHSMSFENRCEEIRAFISALSKNIRYMFKAGLHTVPLKEEWEHLEHYFEMQELLYPGCVFHFIEKNREMESWEIPQMILHTFMENKYKYGIRDGELLSIYISCEVISWKGKQALQIKIEDDGEPFPEKVLKKENRNVLKADGSGAGLFYVEKILEIMYGEEELLRLENPSEGGSRIILVIPQYIVLQVGGAHESIDCGR